MTDLLGLKPLYKLIRDPNTPEDAKKVLASASPLLLAMHLDRRIEAFEHMQYLDAHLVALCHLRLYPDGPGPEPEVWLRERAGRGAWFLGGVGYAVAISDKAYDSGEMILARPGAVQTAGGDPQAVPNADLVVLRLGIAEPPRHGKTTLTTDNLPTWFLLHHPDNSVVVSTYNTTYAQKLGDDYQTRAKQFPYKLPVASDGEPLRVRGSTMDTTSFRDGRDTGEVNFRGFGGSLTGTGWGLGIIDDPFKDQADAMSSVVRADKASWYTSTFRSRTTRRRGSPPPVEVMMFTRWHEDDLAGRFVYDGEHVRPGWCMLRLPALAEADDPLGREVGDPLCPALVTAAFLHSQQTDDPVWFSAIYQGTPSHKAGTMFARTYQPNPEVAATYWHYTENNGFYVCQDGRMLPRSGCTHFITSDWATSKRSSADFSVLSLWAYSIEHRVLVLVRRARDRVSSESHSTWASRFWKEAEPYMPTFMGIENKTFGTSLINELRQDHPEIVIIPLEADTDKISRATGYADAVKAGKVWFPLPARWVDSVAWENEHAAFPNGTHDDQVDTGAYAWARGLLYGYTQQHQEDKPPENNHVAENLARIARANGKPEHPYSRLRRMIR